MFIVSLYACCFTVIAVALIPHISLCVLNDLRSSSTVIRHDMPRTKSHSDIIDQKYCFAET